MRNVSERKEEEKKRGDPPLKFGDFFFHFFYYKRHVKFSEKYYANKIMVIFAPFFEKKKIKQLEQKSMNCTCRMKKENHQEQTHRKYQQRQQQ